MSDTVTVVDVMRGMGIRTTKAQVVGQDVARCFRSLMGAPPGKEGRGKGGEYINTYLPKWEPVIRLAVMKHCSDAKAQMALF